MSDGNDDPNKKPMSLVNSQFAFATAGLKNWTETARAGQDMMFAQMGFNLDLISGLMKPEAKLEPLLYSFLNGSLSPEQRERFAAVKAQLPAPIRMIVEQFEYDPKKFVRDPYKMSMAKWWFSLMPNEGELYKPEYNHQFLSEKSDGTIAAIDPAKVISLFQATEDNGWQKPTKFPRIIYTSSHARGDSLDDVTRITHGIEAVARDSWEGKTLNVGHLDQEVTNDQTLMLFSCETEKNPLLNGINLTERIVELEDNRDLKRADEFKHVSPGALRIARLMLACMSENYYSKDRPPLFDINDPRPLNEIFNNGGDRIHLSVDARKIAQHFQLMAYSKGGNVVSDALRLLQRDLLALDSHDKGIVRTSVHEEDKGYLRTKYGTRSLLHNIECASIAARELPFTEEQKQNGLQRVAFNNKHDPLTSEFEYKGSWNDEFYLIEGVEDPLHAHDPVLALGKRIDPELAATDPNQDAKEARGYVLDDKNVARRMKEFFAPHYGRAAIANLFVEEGSVKIETAPGTTEAQLMAYKPQILEAMQKAGLHNVELIDNHLHIGTFVIQADEDLTRDRDAIKKLGEGFKHLRENAPGLVIAQKINKEDVPSLSKKARALVVGKYSKAEYAEKLQGPPEKGRAA